MLGREILSCNNRQSLCGLIPHPRPIPLQTDASLSLESYQPNVSHQILSIGQIQRVLCGASNYARGSCHKDELVHCGVSTKSADEPYLNQVLIVYRFDDA